MEMISAATEEEEATAEDTEIANHTTITAALMETKAETTTEETAETVAEATEEAAREETSVVNRPTTSTTKPFFIS